MENVKRTRTEAERQTVRFNGLTTGQVADRLSEENITADTVLSWIDAGELLAWDARGGGAKRPRYMIEWRWVVEFLNRRAKNGPIPDPAAADAA